MLRINGRKCDGWQGPGRTLLRGALLCLALVLPAAAAPVQPPPDVKIVPNGEPRVLYDPAKQGCEPNDIPDAPLRGIRDAGGDIVLFGLHYENRALRGRDFGRFIVDCPVAFRGTGNPEPSAHDDRSWITALWTHDGRRVDALVHHEYQAHAHPGRCALPDYLSCWFNTILLVRSDNGGRSFQKAGGSAVVASFPFRQETGQGRHRGFFNPSNIFAHDGHYYALIATTGWDGQRAGACLFRNQDPGDAAGWRAWDGEGFRARFPDPYRASLQRPAACQPVGPFPAPVGSVTRHRGSGAFVAVFQARGDDVRFPVSGFYASASFDLISWSAPTLIQSGATLYDDPCGKGGLINYAALIDPDATGRNFDNTGREALLTYATLAVDGCDATGPRQLIAQPVQIELTRGKRTW